MGGWGWPIADICMLTRWGDQKLRKDTYPRKKLFIACAEKKWTFSWIFFPIFFIRYLLLSTFFQTYEPKLVCIFFQLKHTKSWGQEISEWILRSEFFKFSFIFWTMRRDDLLFSYLTFDFGLYLLKRKNIHIGGWVSWVRVNANIRW